MEIKNLQALCLACKDIDSELEEIKERSKKLNEEKSEIRKQILEHLEEHGLTRFDFGDGKVSISERHSVSLRDKFEFFEWLKAQGTFEDVVTVHSATLNSIYKKEREKAEDEGNVDFITNGLPGLSEPSTFRDIKFYKK